MLKQLAVDGAVDRVEGGWLRTSQPWAYDAEHYDALIAVRNREADIMRRYVRAEGCLMQLLQEALDDPTAQACGRCSVCRGCAARQPRRRRRRSRPPPGWPPCCAAKRTCWSRARCGQAESSGPGADPGRTDGRARPHPDLRRRAGVARRCSPKPAAAGGRQNCSMDAFGCWSSGETHWPQTTRCRGGSARWQPWVIWPTVLADHVAERRQARRAPSSRSPASSVGRRVT